jgi:ABC-type sugar transport system, periplasmic component
LHRTQHVRRAARGGDAHHYVSGRHAPAADVRRPLLPVVLGPFHTISRSSKNPQLAADFALFLTNAENQVKFAKIVTIFPSIIEAAEDPFFAAGGDTPEDQARMIAAGSLWKIDATPTDLPDAARMTQILDDAMTAALLGTKTPRQAIQDAAREWQQILDQSR